MKPSFKNTNIYQSLKMMYLKRFRDFEFFGGFESNNKSVRLVSCSKPYMFCCIVFFSEVRFSFFEDLGTVLITRSKILLGFFLVQLFNVHKTDLPLLKRNKYIYSRKNKCLSVYLTC